MGPLGELDRPLVRIHELLTKCVPWIEPRFERWRRPGRPLLEHNDRFVRWRQPVVGDGQYSGQQLLLVFVVYLYDIAVAGRVQQLEYVGAGRYCLSGNFNRSVE